MIPAPCGLIFMYFSSVSYLDGARAPQKVVYRGDCPVDLRSPWPPFLKGWFPSFTSILVGVYHHPKGTTIFFNGG